MHFWVTNGTVKLNLLNDQVPFITYEVDLLVLIHEGPLVSTNRNEKVPQFCCVN